MHLNYDDQFELIKLVRDKGFLNNDVIYEILKYMDGNKEKYDIKFNNVVENTYHRLKHLTGAKAEEKKFEKPYLDFRNGKIIIHVEDNKNTIYTPKDNDRIITPRYRF